MSGDIVIICPTRTEGLRYCEDNGIEVLKGTRARRAEKSRVRILYGKNGRGRIFSKEDTIYVLHPERISRSSLEALLPCFCKIEPPEELLTAYNSKT